MIKNLVTLMFNLVSTKKYIIILKFKFDNIYMIIYRFIILHFSTFLVLLLFVILFLFVNICLDRPPPWVHWPPKHLISTQSFLESNSYIFFLINILSHRLISSSNQNNNHKPPSLFPTLLLHLFYIFFMSFIEINLYVNISTPTTLTDFII